MKTVSVNGHFDVIAYLFIVLYMHMYELSGLGEKSRPISVATVVRRIYICIRVTVLGIHGLFILLFV